MDRMPHAIQKARMDLLRRCPYMARAAYALIPRPIENLKQKTGGLAGVDKYWRLYFDPQEIEAWSTEKLSRVLEHEIWHLLRRHAKRGEELGISKATARVWNVACDIAINEDIDRMEEYVPEGCYADKFDFPRGMSPEWYYRQLLNQDQDQQMQPGDNSSDSDDKQESGGGSGSGDENEGKENSGSDSGNDTTDDSQSEENSGDSDGDGDSRDSGSAGAGRCGSAATGIQEDWEDGEPQGENDGITEMDADQIIRETAKAAMSPGIGRAPGKGVMEWATEELGGSKLPWRQLLRKYLEQTIRIQGGVDDYSFMQPSRIQTPRIILPGMIARSDVNVGIVLDSSGSMDKDEIEPALSEIGGILKETGGQTRITVAVTDTDAHIQRVRRVQDIEIVGRGGTDMMAGIDAVLKADKNVSVIVVITDGRVYWGDKPTKPVIVVLVGKHKGSGPDWAKTVEVDND